MHIMDCFPTAIQKTDALARWADYRLAVVSNPQQCSLSILPHVYSRPNLIFVLGLRTSPFQIGMIKLYIEGSLPKIVVALITVRDCREII